MNYLIARPGGMYDGYRPYRMIEVTLPDILNADLHHHQFGELAEYVHCPEREDVLIVTTDDEPMPNMPRITMLHGPQFDVWSPYSPEPWPLDLDTSREETDS